ncbi:MAG: serine hydrolase [Vicinamibacterales bacterium]
MPSSASFREVHQLLHRASTDRRVFPAVAAEFGSSDGVIWRDACGRLTFDADANDAEVGTIFDLASLTKPIATTSAVLSAVHRGALRLGECVSQRCADWRGSDRDAVTIQDLLEHCSGLSARLLDRPPDTQRAFEHEICTMPLEYAPRTRALYSDLGFILLSCLLERAAECAFADLIDTILSRTLHGRLDTEAALLTRVPVGRQRLTAPTVPLVDDRRQGRRLVGEVHDSYAALLGGCAGHAGLFGNVSGVGAFARVVLGAVRGDRSFPEPFTPELMRLAVARSAVPGSSRALGWDTMLPTSSCGTRLSPEAFGHVGFTGTSLWIDPVRDRYYVLLANRACGGGTSDEMQQVRRAFHDALADR